MWGERGAAGSIENLQQACRRASVNKYAKLQYFPPIPRPPTIEVFFFPFSSAEKSRLRSCAITTDLYLRLGVGAALISFVIRALSVATTPLALSRLYLALFVWVLFLTRRRRGRRRRRSRRRRRRSHLSIFLTGCTSQQT
jgi:hypothetical protein